MVCSIYAVYCRSNNPGEGCPKAAARLIDSIVTLLQIFSSQVKLKSRNETSIFIG
jgi:hypothetical protein